MEYELFCRMAKVTLGQEKADLVLRNARIVDVFTEEIRQEDVAICQGYIAGTGSFSKGKQELDLAGAYLLPGLMDAHVHLESSMVTPGEMVAAAAACGTTTFIVDPHEAANVAGPAGIDYILEQTQDSPANVFLMLPSCVPATEFDDNGCRLDAAMMRPYLSNPRILGLGEVMNCPGVIHGDPELHEKLRLLEGKVLDGHAPSLWGSELSVYALAGIGTDHESADFAHALEKVRRGMHVHIREGSAARNLEEIVKGLLDSGLPEENFSFCTDDKHIEDILEEGHIDYNVRRAIALGMDPVKAIKMATINTARCYGLTRLGAIAPGYQADLVVTEDLRRLPISRVFHKGRELSDQKAPVIRPCPSELRQTMHLPFLQAADFCLPVAGRTPVIGLVGGQILTRHETAVLKPADNYRPTEGLNKAAVLERHKGTGRIGIALCRGYGIRGGAVASSVSHDSHNLIVVGDNDEDMAMAANAVIEAQGGFAIAAGGSVTEVLPLPVLGLMSEAGYERVNGQLKRMIQKVHQLGVEKEIDPFVTLSFLALPVIPELRITPRGLFDVDKFQLI